MWCAARVDHEEIDAVNILNATMLAMRRATEGLFEKYSCHHPEIKRQRGVATSDIKKQLGAGTSTGPVQLEPAACIALVDGNRAPEGMPVPRMEWVVKVGRLLLNACI
jgi:hypothetical protein